MVQPRRGASRYPGPLLSLRPCLQRGCSEPALSGNSRCITHQRERWGQHNQEPYRAAYGGIYPTLRKQVLKEEPTCHWRYEGCTIKSTQADHVLPARLGGTNDRSNLRGSCQSCNLKRRGQKAGTVKNGTPRKR